MRWKKTGWTLLLLFAVIDDDDDNHDDDNDDNYACADAIPFEIALFSEISPIRIARRWKRVTFCRHSVDPTVRHHLRFFPSHFSCAVNQKFIDCTIRWTHTKETDRLASTQYTCKNLRFKTLCGLALKASKLFVVSWCLTSLSLIWPQDQDPLVFSIGLKFNTFPLSLYYIF